MKQDIYCIDVSKTLLATPQCFLPIANRLKQLQGVYLYYALNTMVWIRLGNVMRIQATVQEFDVRNGEIFKKAKDN